MYIHIALLALFAVCHTTPLPFNLDAVSLDDYCSSLAKHGLYTIVPANVGFAFNGSTGDDEGVMILPNNIGGGCRAKTFKACNYTSKANDAVLAASSDGSLGCQSVVACNDTDQQSCFTCVKAKFQRIFSARVKAFVDCDDEVTSIQDATSQQQLEVLAAIKEVAINECSLKACRYATESRSGVRFSDTNLKFLARHQRHVRAIRKCPAMRTIHNTSGGCRWSLRRLPRCYFAGFPFPCSAPSLKLVFHMQAQEDAFIAYQTFNCHLTHNVPKLQLGKDYKLGGLNSISFDTFTVDVHATPNAAFYVHVTMSNKIQLQCPWSSGSFAAGQTIWLNTPISMTDLVPGMGIES
eukprot:m.2743 g.2743  ORF g.2743 m.2743 type:complete len:351 (-) comp3985_c0_seq1:144-1196(-)